ncbi:MAG: rhodanese-like domain-containing protein [Ginsengibacter sp.]
MKSSKLSSRTVIDVRRTDEFNKGHAKDSINIPLQELEKRLDEIRNLSQPLVVVCGGGTRHVKAYELLKANGIQSQKGGGWKTVD